MGKELFTEDYKMKVVQYVLEGHTRREAPNLIERNLHAESPNQKWTIDITQFSLFGRKLYLSPILDMYNREIISYLISQQANFQQVTEMLSI